MSNTTHAFARLRAREDAERLRDEYLRRIDAQALLDWYAPDNVIPKGNEVIHSCLLDRVDPHHANGDANPSASMNIEKKVYNCYSYGGMDLFQFVLKMEGCDEFYEIVPLLGRFLGDGTKNVDDFVEELSKYLASNDYAEVSVPRYHERVLAQWDFYHPYLADRGITFDAAQRLRIGYDERSRRITIPHWVDGVLVGWQRRAIFDPQYPVTEVERDHEGNELDGGKIPKYKNSSGFPKYDTLYNLDRVRERGYESAIVVESPMSVAKAESLWSGSTDDPLGSVVATFSAKVGPRQLDLLRRFEKLTVWFDDDPSGHLGALKVIRGTYRHVRVDHVRPEPDRDLGDHTEASEVRRILTEAEPSVLALARLEKIYGR